MSVVHLGLHVRVLLNERIRKMDPLVKDAYIKRFGETKYNQNFTQIYAQPTPTLSSWFYLSSKLYFLQYIMFLSMLTNKTKGAHPPFSVVAMGHFVPDPSAAKRFELKRFPLLIRHTYSQMKGAHPLSKAVKSLAVQIGDAFHLTFLSGTSCPFFNTETFEKFMEMQNKMVKGEPIWDMIEKYPCLWNAALSVPPKGSQSYLDLVYSTMMPYNEQKTGQLIKFKIVAERAKPFQITPEHIENFPKEGIFYDLSDEKKAATIYDQEYLARFKEKGELRYTMTYQERPDTLVNRNASFPWNGEDSIQFGTLIIDRVAPRDDGTTTFDILKMPPNLYLPDAETCSDPRVIGHIRKVIYPNLQWVREGFIGCGIF